MIDDELAFTPAVEQAALVRTGQVRSRELTDAYLDRIGRFDGDLNAFVEVRGDEARAAADAADAAAELGGDLPSLLGVPISIKNLNFLEGARVTLGTSAWAEQVAEFDDEVVGRLKAAGCVPLGTTNVPEFGTIAHAATSTLGVARNPWDHARNAAGSSSGAAAGLAAGLCAAAQGSDGGGSIRIPAAVNGVVGLKPARDRVSNGPLSGDLGSGLSTNGVLTRTVADAAAFLDAVSGYALGDPGMAPPPARPFREEVGADHGPARLAVTTTSPLGRDPHPAVVAAVERGGALLEDLGHAVEPVDLPLDASLIEPFTTIWSAGVGSQPFDPEEYEPVNRWLAARSRQETAAELAGAQWQLQLLVRQTLRVLAPYDALLAPVVWDLALPNDRYDDVGPAEVFRDQAEWVGLTPFINATGQPAIALPVHRDEASGLPVGVQLVGRPWGEAALLRLAAQVEAAAGGFGAQPRRYAA